MTIGKHIRVLAVFGLIAPVMMAPATADADQRFIKRQQIIRQLQATPQALAVPEEQVGQRKFRRAPQPESGKFTKFRTPQPDSGQFPTIRAPQPEGPVVMRRAPQPEGPVVMRRAPQPDSGQFPTIRAPQPDSPVVMRRAPQPSEPVVQEFRAPAPQEPAQAPRPRRDRETKVASTERGLDVRPVEREQESLQTATNYPDRGRVDLEILFDYDSDRIDPASVKQLIELGEALNDPSLASASVVIAGHTDAAGSNAYNMDLSVRRARAVTEFLVNYSGIAPDRLQPQGFGEEFLKYPDAPESGQNRRVEIINLGEAG
ncbi:MAG: hypothetical protein BroJett030_29690 [Alphaproteobacteria bacterium]|nr:MAG: hypothetical protein BroJett030_29690 [Alphaproteobacteria bacterium]